MLFLVMMTMTAERRGTMNAAVIPTRSYSP